MELLITDTAEVEEGMRNAPYRYLKIILTATVEKGKLDEPFDCSIER